MYHYKVDKDHSGTRSNGCREYKVGHCSCECFSGLGKLCRPDSNVEKHGFTRRACCPDGMGLGC